jgi:maleylacetoacetate isomerase
MAELPQLYSYWRSSCSYRVRIALHLKGLPFATLPVHLVKDGGQQLTAEYAAINPMRAVPALAIDGALLTQSTAIIEYLEETRGAPAFPPLLPADAPSRARVRELCAIIANDVQPLGNLRVLKHVAALVDGGAGSGADAAAVAAAKEAAKGAWARQYMAAGFAAVEALLARSAGTFAVGDAVTMADVFLAPQVYNAVRFKLDMAPYPTLVRVHAAAEGLPAFKAAHPSAQPDAEA